MSDGRMRKDLPSKNKTKLEQTKKKKKTLKIKRIATEL